jgi:hypothetical protein
VYSIESLKSFSNSMETPDKERRVCILLRIWGCPGGDLLSREPGLPRKRPEIL